MINFLKTLYIHLRIKIQRPFVKFTYVLNQKIYFQISSKKEYYYRFRDSFVSEKTTMYWIENIINPDEVVWDIGANVGAYSLLIGSIMNSKNSNGIVYSFEPESSNFNSLNRNVQLNNLSQYILPISIAFSNQLKLTKFFLSSIETGSATHSIDHPYSDGTYFSPKYVQGVFCSSINDFVNTPGVLFPNHIKIDVDGVELDIVNNMATVLKDDRLRSVVIEVDTSNSNGVIEKLFFDSNFKIFMEESWVSSEKTITNYIFKK